MQDGAHLPHWARVRPLARYPSAQSSATAEVLVLQLGDNPTTDYYLRPRLEASGAAWRTADLRDDPRSCALLTGEQPISVVFCRYAHGRWLDALERARSRIVRAALMVDDDFAAMMLDPSLPLAYRVHLVRWHGRWTGRLSRICSEVWASTPVLAARYGTGAVFPPVPDSDPPVPQPNPPPLVIYPGQALHARERAFVVEVAALVLRRRPDIRFEVTAPASEGGLPANVGVVPERPWPLYRQSLAGRSAAVSLAPLFPSAVNAARAPVKMFDAARVGAAGLYADTAPFKGFVCDGVDGLLASMEPPVWAEAIMALVDDPARRLALASAARDRLVGLRRNVSPLPEASS